MSNVYDEEGSYDAESALVDLQRKYGYASKGGRKRKSRAQVIDEAQEATDTAHNGNEEHSEDQFELPRTKKGLVKRSEIVAVEENRPIADALLEMARIYEKNHNLKGGKYV
jgi:hypothetical protein